VAEARTKEGRTESPLNVVARPLERILASTIPWFVLFALFVLVNAYVHRLWIWDIGDDQNLMMPAIDLGRGYTPNIDFLSGYPGLTFYIQRLVMLFTGELPLSEHVYSALQAAFLGGIAAWTLRRWYPPALVWLLVVFLWTGGHALNPTPNPGYMVEPLVLVAMVLTERLGRHGRLKDAAVAGAIAGLAFLFKQYGIMVPVAFVLYTSFACLASPARPERAWLRGGIVVANAAAFAAYFWLYVAKSVLMVPHVNQEAAAALPVAVVAFLSPWVFALVCLAVLAIRPRALLTRGLALSELIRANVAFLCAFIALGIVAFALIYGPGPASFTAIRAVLFDAPKLINANIVPMQPLQLWPEVPVTCLVVLGPLILKELKNPALQLAVLVGIAGVVLYAARTYTNLSGTIVPTLTFFLLVATYLAARPTGDAWSWFFVFVAGSTMLAYLIPYPAYAFNMGILVVSGWAMMGGTFHSTWPRLVNPLGAVALAVILALALVDGRSAMARMTTYQVGAHSVKSYDPMIGVSVDAANQTTAAEAQQDLYTYLTYLAHLSR
jgi:hypothetical protein